MLLAVFVAMLVLVLPPSVTANERGKRSVKDPINAHKNLLQLTWWAHIAECSTDLPNRMRPN